MGKREIRLLPPAEQIVNSEYDLKLLKGPALKGKKLKLFSMLSELPIYSMICRKLKRVNGLPQVLRETAIPEMPMFKPEIYRPLHPENETFALDPKDDAGTVLRKVVDSIPSFTAHRPREKGKRLTIRDFHNAYLSGAAVPLNVACDAICEMHANEDEYKWFIAWDEKDIYRQAWASSQRYAEGKPLSVLDGVLYCVKDHIDALPYKTTGGTGFMADRREVIEEAPIVKTLRSLGAIVLGKTNMHELGFGTTGVNTTWGTPVNPWGRGRYPGGSSSGSGAAVGAGLCPFSIGSDAGGSIRNPSSWNGCVGLLPTMGRVPEEGSISISPSLSRLGPIAGCVEDATILYSLMADGNAPELNPVNIPQLNPGSNPLKGLRIGVFWEWFNDASEEVVIGCKKAVEAMQDLGAQVKSVRIPELDLCRVGHAITVSTEISSAVGPSLYNKSILKTMDKDVMLNLKTSMSMRSTEYVQAQRVRRRMALHWKRVMRDIDFIVTPTTPTTAQKCSKTSLSGEASLKRTSEMMRFVLPANFLGLPAIAVPVGKDCEGLPISLQLVGKHCTEATLLRAAYHLETDLDRNGLGCKHPKICIHLFKSVD